MTEDWYFISHRLSLAQAAQASGYDVGVATRVTVPGQATLQAAGLHVHALRWRRGGGRWWEELGAWHSLWRFLRAWRPDVLHLVALKPAVIGGILGRLTGIPHQVIAISGLGHVFSARGLRWRLLRTMISRLLRWLVAGPSVRIIVQNPADERFVQEQLRVPAWRVRRQRGAGVELDRYRASPLPPGPPCVLMAGRLLRSKGVQDFVEAATRLARDGVAARFRLLGDPDDGSYDAFTSTEIRKLVRDSPVVWEGRTLDMPAALANAHLVVLPTRYGEGVPKILLEAAACGRAIVASDSPGCREAVVHGVTGLLVPPGDLDALTRAMESLLTHPNRLRELGVAGRALAQREFGAREVHADTLRLYRDLLERGPDSGPPNATS